MRVLGLILFLGGLLMVSCGQEDYKSSRYAELTEVYATGVRSGDLEVATQAVYSIRVLFPEKRNWIDSLAGIYFARNAPLQALRCAEEALKDSVDHAMLFVKASSLKAVKAFPEAILAYQDLFKVKEEVRYLYDIANMQYAINRVSECTATLQGLLKHSKAKTARVELTFNKQKQEIIMEAAALNMLGVIAKESGDGDSAKSFFLKALETQPDFLLAKGNIKAL